MLIVVVIAGLVYGLMMKIVYPSSEGAVFPNEIKDYYMNNVFKEKTFEMFKNDD